MTIGERIKKVRIFQNISQKELADKINVSKQTLYKYERDIITNIPSDKIECIATVLKISPAYLMGWDDTNHKDYNQDSFSITDHEKNVVIAYREKPDMQSAVDTLLGVTSTEDDIPFTSQKEKHA